MSSEAGVVYLVGAGPGDPGLLTRRGEELLESANCVVHDGLVSAAILALVGAGAELIYAGKKRAGDAQPLTQEEIVEILIERARAGEKVVRLKGGDPFVFGRGAEEARALVAAGVRFEIVPGVSAATAVPAYAGIALTARGMTSTVSLVTGHEADKGGSDVDWDAVAGTGTVVLFMALATLSSCVDKLMKAGRAADTPAAAIYWGTTGAQRTVVSTLSKLPRACRDAQLRPPVLVVVGEVVALREAISWWESRPLFGKRVLLMRPGALGRSLARRVANLGGEPIYMPVTRVVARPIGTELTSARDRLLAGQLDWVVFASAHAVDHFFWALGVLENDARCLAGARVAAVGDKTAEALRAHGIRADLVPPRGDAVGLAKAVATASDGASSRVLVPRAANGRPELINGLREHFDEVAAVDVYETQVCSAQDPRLASGLRKLREGNVDVALFFSPSQVESLFAILGEPAQDVMQSVGLNAAIGKTTARAMAEHGVEADIIAERPSAESLLDAVVDEIKSH